MKYINSIKIHCTSESSEEDFQKDKYMENLTSLVNEVGKVFQKYGIEINHYDVAPLNKIKHSIAKCSECGHWMVDRLSNPVKGRWLEEQEENIIDGATYKDEFLCEDCLPKDHRWSTK